jgi:condensin complex subunit 1
MKKQVKYCKEAIHFITEIHGAIPVLCQLLGSKNASDILETIEFFVAATSFGVEQAQVRW